MASPVRSLGSILLAERVKTTETAGVGRESAVDRPLSVSGSTIFIAPSTPTEVDKAAPSVVTAPSSEASAVAVALSACSRCVQPEQVGFSACGSIFFNCGQG